jgi:hypothetical protein
MAPGKGVQRRKGIVGCFQGARERGSSEKLTENGAGTTPLLASSIRHRNFEARQIKRDYTPAPRFVSRFAFCAMTEVKLGIFTSVLLLPGQRVGT